jgi:hypothetical protein
MRDSVSRRTCALKQLPIEQANDTTVVSLLTTRRIVGRERGKRKSLSYPLSY